MPGPWVCTVTGLEEQMNGVLRGRLYRHRGVGLLRAAAAPSTGITDGWPDLADPDACRTWLRTVWAHPDFADGVRQASPGLADLIEALCDDQEAPVKDVQRATRSVLRYVLRATGRHTPFGLFAGVAPAWVGSTARVRWGDEHRAVARVDAQWLADVIGRLETDPELLERLEVVFNDLAVQRGGRLHAPHGPTKVSIRNTSAVQAARDAASSPLRFGTLANKLTEAFPGAERATVCGMLTDLTRQGLLITCLRAPLTVPDQLAHLLDRLREVGADDLPSVAPMLHELESIASHVNAHNEQPAVRAQALTREYVGRRMSTLSREGRTRLAVDLRLDCAVQLPEDVAREVEWAATALARLGRQLTGEPAWRDYYSAFCDRYGVGSLVPLRDVVDPDAGLGMPNGYPGSVLPSPSGAISSQRDELLLTMAWQTMAGGVREIVLTDDLIDDLAVGDPSTRPRIPPHVEVGARIHAVSIEALNRGDFTLTVHPGRCAGTLTSRFATIIPNACLDDVYRAVPVATNGAIAVQVSFPPAYAHAENVIRLPAHLPHVLPLGEHRAANDADTLITLDDLAVTATRDELMLVSLSRRQVIEPQVFHALALDKQAPPLARFIAHLSRAFGAAWTEFDWGTATHHMPYLPRVRYRRSVLSPARWRLSASDLPAREVGDDAWRQALAQWRRRWHCDATVELLDADRSLPLDLDEPAHAAILRAYLERHGRATLSEAVDPAAAGWIGGHAHEVVFPLFSTCPPARSPRVSVAPLVTNGTHGQPPGGEASNWLNAKVYTHPERLDELIAQHLPTLLAGNGETACWFVRYRSLHDSDHLRLRIRTTDVGQRATWMAAVGAWVDDLRRQGVVGRLVFDTYYPEVGRYGFLTAMDAAEKVFVADSAVVTAQLRHLFPATVSPIALAAINLVEIVRAFHGGLPQAMQWLTAHGTPPGAASDREAAEQVTGFFRPSPQQNRPAWAQALTDVWSMRAAALAACRAQLPGDVDEEAVLESLLHMHHNRALGIDPDSEKTCRRLARQAALAWTAHQPAADS